MTWCLKFGKGHVQISEGEAETVSSAIQDARRALDKFWKDNREIMRPTRFRITVRDGQRCMADLGL